MHILQTANHRKKIKNVRVRLHLKGLPEYELIGYSGLRACCLGEISSVAFTLQIKKLDAGKHARKSHLAFNLLQHIAAIQHISVLTQTHTTKGDSLFLLT